MKSAALQALNSPPITVELRPSPFDLSWIALRDSLSQSRDVHMTHRLDATARGLALLLACLPALASADPLTDLRTELDGLKSSYDMRILQLEQRIAQLESQLGSDRQATDAQLPPPAEQGSPSVATSSGANAFNPSLSLILAGTYTQTSRDPTSYRIAGFIPAGTSAGPGSRSFNLGESELGISANVDPYFFGNLTASLGGDNQISVEEAFVRTTALPAGLTIKAGRFFSGLGYLNSVHAHAWDFVDQPLAYQAFLGSQFAQDGVQIKWLAPTDLFVELGLESGRGSDFPATPRSANGLNGVTAFAHLGDDIGDSASWRAGVALLSSRAEQRQFSTQDANGIALTGDFTGNSRTWVGDFTWKWAPHGNPTEHQLKIQGEYLKRTENGNLSVATDGSALAGAYRSNQSGWYLQTVYQFSPRLRGGLRYDTLDSGVAPNELLFPFLQHATPHRTSVMLDWNLSEFSRLRAQYAQDAARGDSADQQFLLQYLFSLGAHGAHKF